MARTPQDHQIRIIQILDAAEPLFIAKGYSETTISDIAKKIGVAQGMLYYYFKSKEEIMEELINRGISFFISDIKDIALSNSLTPARKIELLVHAMLQIVRSKEGLLNFIYDDQNLHLKDKLSRQANLLLAPWLMKIIEEGVNQKVFCVIHAKTSLDYILLIMNHLVDACNEKMPPELFSYQLRMAEAIIEKSLGAKDGTIHISL